VALVSGVPQTLGLKQCLQHFLGFREQVVTRRAQHALAKATTRLHLVEGLLLALQQLEAVVQVWLLVVWTASRLGVDGQQLCC
jgi:DNA gyrase subunit A